MARSRLNALEVLKHLPRTSCAECGLPTCFAFANQVALGLRQATECPYATPALLEGVDELVEQATDLIDEQEEVLDDLTRRVRQVPFQEVAEAVGAGLVDGQCLAFRCLGKEFIIDARGRLRSQCHASFWVLLPLLDTIVRAADRLRRDGGERGPDGGPGWIKFDELPQAMSRSDFFSEATEGALRDLADRDLELLRDLLEVFGAREADHGFDADMSLVIRPLPRFPLLLCYWKQEGPFESKLGIYFDRRAADQLSVEGVYILVTGLVTMLKKIVARHSFEGRELDVP